MKKAQQQVASFLLLNPADHTIGDLLGNSQNEIYEIKNLQRGISRM